MRRCSHLLLSTGHAAVGISRPPGPQQQTDTAAEWWDWWTDRQMLDSFIDCSVHCKNVALTRFPSVRFRSWSRFLAVSLQFTWIINLTVGCHYFPPGLQLPPQPLRGLLPISLLGEQRHDGCEQFTWDCYPTALRLRFEPKPFCTRVTLTTRLPSHPTYLPLCDLINYLRLMQPALAVNVHLAAVYLLTTCYRFSVVISTQPVHTICCMHCSQSRMLLRLFVVCILPVIRVRYGVAIIYLFFFAEFSALVETLVSLAGMVQWTVNGMTVK